MRPDSRVVLLPHDAKRKVMQISSFSFIEQHPYRRDLRRARMNLKTYNIEILTRSKVLASDVTQFVAMWTGASRMNVGVGPSPMTTRPPVQDTVIHVV